MKIAALLCLALVAGSVDAAPRSRAVRAEFQRISPCPATGATRGACRGYVVDHRVPLCAGGPDSIANMQWQTTDAAKLKDRQERLMCRRH